MTTPERAQLRDDLKTAGFIEVASGGTLGGRTTKMNETGVRCYVGFENGKRRIFYEVVAEFKAVTE